MRKLVENIAKALVDIPEESWIREYLGLPAREEIAEEPAPEPATPPAFPPKQDPNNPIVDPNNPNPKNPGTGGA